MFFWKKKYHSLCMITRELFFLEGRFLDLILFYEKKQFINKNKSDGIILSMVISQISSEGMVLSMMNSQISTFPPFFFGGWGWGGVGGGTKTN